MTPAELKTRISLEHELSRRGLLAHLKKKPGALVGPCPIHGGDNKTAFVLDTRKQIWHCFTGCRRGGDLFDLVRLLDGVTFRQAFDHLAGLAGTPSIPRPGARDSRREFQPFTWRLPLDGTHPFIKSKGITPATAAYFEAGHAGHRGFLADCIGIRLFDHDGKPLGYAGRRLEPLEIERFGKWKFPRSFPKSAILFNHHRLDTEKPLVLTECPWSVMRLHQLGFQAAALLGTTISPSQVELLARFPLISIFFDGDPAGRTGAARVESIIRSRTRVARLDPGKNLDPDDLDDASLRKSMAQFVFP